MLIEILFFVLLAYATLVTIWIVRRTIGTFTITVKSDGSLSGRMDMAEDIDEIAKHKTMICNVRTIRE